MKEAEVAEEEWLPYLSSLFTGKSVSIYSTGVSIEDKNNYSSLRKTLLNSCGHTIEECY